MSQSSEQWLYSVWFKETGYYSIKYRSFLEFFVVYKIAAKLGILAKDFADIAEIPQFQDKED